MDKNDLKKMIKPLIKECLTELLFEKGMSKLIDESLSAKQKELVVETKQPETYEAKEVKFLKANVFE